MRKVAMCVALGLVAGTWGYSTRAADEAPKPAAPANSSTGDTTGAFPQGFKRKDINDVKDIRSELGNLAEDAIKKDHFDNFLGNLVDEDRSRLSNDKKRNVDELNGKTNVIREAWKNKYGKDFDVKDDMAVFPPKMVAITTGEVSDSALAVINWPLDARTGKAPTLTQEATAAAAHEAGKVLGGKKKLDNGRNVALVRIAESHGAPALTLSMIHELPDHWRFDIPNDRTGDQIYADLVKHLDFVATHVDQWPSDVNDGYAMVSHHVLMAVYGVEHDMKHDAPKKG